MLKKVLLDAEVTIEQRNKAIALVVGMLVLIFGDRVGIGADELTAAISLIVAYILGDAYQKRNS